MHADDNTTIRDATTDGPQFEFLNQEQRTILLLLLDVSGSVLHALMMLIAGLRALGEYLAADQIARNRVDLAIVAFGNNEVRVVQEFTTVAEFQAPTLNAGGNTPLGRAINVGLDKIHERKTMYKQHGIDYTRPWLFLITDARGTDDVTTATERLHREAADKRVAVYAVGFGEVDMAALARITPPDRPPLLLDGLKFNELFQWLSTSIRRVSASKTGAQVSLPPTDTWAVTTA